MSRFVIEIPDAPPEWPGSDGFAVDTYWGCRDDSLYGWAIVEDAVDEHDALRMLPDGIRNRARVTKVNAVMVEEPVVEAVAE